MEYISIGKVSKILGVCVETLRNWELCGYLNSSFKTLGGHRRYLKSNILELIKFIKDKRINIIYSRVSSYDQKNDLIRQTETLKNYVDNLKLNNKVEVIEDLGSGLNFKKKGLKLLIKLIINNKINKIFITHKDRLLRFGTELIISICKEFNTEVVIINNKLLTFEQELSQDVLEIITVFSAKLYGSRSHKNMKKQI